MLEWTRYNPGHYATTGPLTADRFEIIRIEKGWELTDRNTGNVTIHSTLKASKAAAEES